MQPLRALLQFSLYKVGTLNKRHRHIVLSFGATLSSIRLPSTRRTHRRAPRSGVCPAAAATNYWSPRLGSLFFWCQKLRGAVGQDFLEGTHFGGGWTTAFFLSFDVLLFSFLVWGGRGNPYFETYPPRPRLVAKSVQTSKWLPLLGGFSTRHGISSKRASLFLRGTQRLLQR